MIRSLRWPSAVGSLVFAVGMSAACTHGEDFRIESKTYAGKDKAPKSESVTLFRAGIVYDYLLDTSSVAVFDKAHGRFILLDPARHVKTEVKVADVLAFSQTMKDAAGQSQNKLIRFAANPEFHSDFDAESDELTLTSPFMTYHVLTAKTKNAEEAQQYHEFSDWYVRLNAMLNPGSTPPFPRLVLNEHLANRESIAKEVQLTIPSQGKLGGKPQELRSKHIVSWRLLPRDLNKIAEIGNQLTAFRTVSFSAFRAPAEKAPPAVTKR